MAVGRSLILWNLELILGNALEITVTRVYRLTISHRPIARFISSEANKRICPDGPEMGKAVKKMGKILGSFF